MKFEINSCIFFSERIFFLFFPIPLCDNLVCPIRHSWRELWRFLFHVVAEKCIRLHLSTQPWRRTPLGTSGPRNKTPDDPPGLDSPCGLDSLYPQPHRWETSRLVKGNTSRRSGFPDG